MDTYRVTYTTCVGRQAFGEAHNAEHAVTLVRDQMHRDEHHHACQNWTNDWEAELANPYWPDWFCFECDRTVD